MKRLREVVLGVPGLLGWQLMEARTPAARAHPLPGALS
jgi:hypothetical protein